MGGSRRFVVGLVVCVLGASAVVGCGQSPSTWSLRSTIRVSVATEGVPGDGYSEFPAMSANGQAVAFASDATNLVAGDTNAARDVFVRDGLSKRTERASVAADGTQGNGQSLYASVSGDGRLVAFESSATNLVPGDTNGVDDVFVRDTVGGTTERLNITSSEGQAGCCGAQAVTLSADGRFAAFENSGPLEPSDTNGQSDVYVRDRVNGTTERVSVSSSGAQTDSYSIFPMISGDGRFVVFFSAATNLVPGDTNGIADLFVRDRVAGATERITVAAGGGQTTQVAYPTGISQDGRSVIFASRDPNLVPGDSNGKDDVFLRDRGAGTTERISVSFDGGEANGHSGSGVVSADGRYVAFSSGASNLVPGETTINKVFVRDRLLQTTESVSVGSDGTEPLGSNSSPSISADGRYVAFASTSTKIDPPDTSTSDIYVRDVGPTFRLSPSTSSEPVGSDVVLHTVGGLTNDSVLFEIISGPNVGTRGECVSPLASSVTQGRCLIGSIVKLDVNDPAGLGAAWRYHAGINSGTDRVRATVDLDNDGRRDLGEPTAYARVTFDREPISQVALGDSYSSGEGVGGYLAGSDDAQNRCHRSGGAYPMNLPVPDPWRNQHVAYRELIRDQAGGSVTFGACSGARIANVVNPAVTQWNEPRQLAYIPSSGVKLLTIGIGGNDAAFGDILSACYRHACLGGFNFRNGQNVQQWFNGYLGTIENDLRQTLTEARTLSGADASVILLGYPHIFPVDQPSCPKLIPLRGEMTTLNDMTTQLNDMMERVSAEVGVHFLSLERTYNGHEVCGLFEEWINGPVINWRPGQKFVDLASFHPKRQGHAATAELIGAFFDGWINEGKPLTRAALPANPAPQAPAAGSESAAAIAAPAPAPTLAITPSSTACAAGQDGLAPGQSVSVSGTDWQPGSSVHVGYVSSETGELTGVNATANSTGAISAQLTMPTASSNVVGGFDALGLDTAGVSFRTGVLAMLNSVPGPCVAGELAPTSVGTPVVIPVLQNDTGSPVPNTVEVTVAPGHGSTTVSASTGAVTYTPSGDFTGIDVFTYQACDSAGRCDTAEVGVGVGVTCTISGTEGDDQITGTSGNDVICALGGNDTVDGLAGADVILGGPGIDELFGGPGDDSVFGGAGDDFLNGGPGVDRLDGGGGVNRLFETSDEGAPTVTATIPADGAQYVRSSVVNANYACADNDGGVGVARCAGPVAPGQPINTATLGAHSFVIEAVDWAGNATTRTVNYQVVAG